MSILYCPEVIKIVNDTTIEIEVHVIHPDACEIYVTPGFALMIISEAEACAELEKIIDLDTLLDENWMQQNAKGFIRKVELIKEKNLPSRDILYTREVDIWYTKYLDNISGVLRIEVTHPKWIENINTGDRWESTAFDIAYSYDDCEPILPEEKVDVTDLIKVNNSLGFVVENQMENIFSQISIPPPTTNEPSYFVAIKGKQRGPFNKKVLYQLIRDKQMDKGTLVWREGMENWAEANLVPELSTVFNSFPPPLPKR